MLYESLLRHPDWDLETTAVELGWSAEQLRARLDELAGAGLVVASQEHADAHRIVTPELGMSRILDAMTASLQQGQADLAQLRRRGHELSEVYRTEREARTVRALEVFDDRDAVVTALGELLSNASHSVDTMLSHRPSEPALAQARRTDRELLERGVRTRFLYISSAANDSHASDYMKWLVSLGAQVRLAPVLPTRMIVVDGAAAMVAQDPDDPGRGALLVRHPGLVHTFSALFRSCWDAVVPAPGLESPGKPAAPSPVERQVLVLMSQGYKDETIARHLKVSVRTIRRLIADLATAAGAGSRFALAAHAVRSGWIS